MKRFGKNQINVPLIILNIDSKILLGNGNAIIT